MKKSFTTGQDLIAAVKEAIHHARTASVEPYRDNQITENVRIRRFSESVRDEDLVWHRDERDRKITVLEGRGWQFQRDNELPQEMRPSQVIEVRAGEWHRVIKGAGQLHTIILESKSVISEQSKTEMTPDELEVVSPKQEAEPTRFEVEWNDPRFVDASLRSPLGKAREGKLSHNNADDERAVVSALNILTTGRSSDGPWTHIGGQAPYDIGLERIVTLEGFTFPDGEYEVKRKSGDNLARLGDAKSIPVRTVPSMSALASIGSAFGNYERSLGTTGEWPDGLSKDPFSVMTRWKNLAALSLTSEIIGDLKNGTMKSQLEELRKTLFSYLSGSSVEEEEDSKVTIRAELPPEERDGKADYEAEIDLDLFATRVKPYLTQKGKVNFDDGMTEEQYEALTEFYNTLALGLKRLPDADGFKKLFDELAEKTQTGTVKGIFAWDKKGFKFYEFQELTVKSMTYGRLVLAPKTESDD